MVRCRVTNTPLDVTIFKTAEQCLAKTWNYEDRCLPGRSVYEHCAIVGSVAQALIQLFPDSLKSLFPEGSAVLAACHDIGKVSPSFYSRLELAVGHNTEELSKLCAQTALKPDAEWLKGYERNSLGGGHAAISYATLKKLTESRGVASVAGMHHGSCSKQALTLRTEWPQLGGASWEKEREALVKKLEELFQKKISSEAMADESAIMLLAGLTTVADWIGSGRKFDDPSLRWQNLIDDAVRECGFSRISIKEHLQFGDIFQSAQGTPFTPNSAQKAFSSDNIQCGGIYVLEAPMGMGKTEAALYAAYLAMEKGISRGVYFALPSQITANKVYERFCEFLSRTADGGTRAQLLHGKAHIFLQQVEQQVQFTSDEASPGGSWFSSKKRGLLSPFAVGTVDQMLLAVMAVRHGFVRAFGLAGKVVIIDEVHSYDAYTSCILIELIKLLRDLKCVVIILSATLTDKARSRLLLCDQDRLAGPHGYPQISAAVPGQSVRTTTLEAPESHEVAVVFKRGKDGESEAVTEAILRAERGEQVLWIENDIRSAQDIYRRLAARTSGMKIECGLLHSRFTAEDRSAIERRWVDRFGKKGHQDRVRCGRILVGTQILEQSLDIDADFLVSRFAVLDMVFQRVGRLWRHENTPRPPCAKREIWLLAPSLAEALENPEKNFGASAWVYAPYCLCRSLETIEARNTLKIPSDIPEMLEQTYRDREENEQYVRLRHKLMQGCTQYRSKVIGTEQMERMARGQLVDVTGIVEDDDLARTRLTDRPTVELLLVRHFNPRPKEKDTELQLLTGEIVHLPRYFGADDLALRREIAGKLSAGMVKVYADEVTDLVIKSGETAGGLSRVMYAGEMGLHVGVVTEVGRVESVNGTETNLNYSTVIGWERRKQEDDI